MARHWGVTLLFVATAPVVAAELPARFEHDRVFVEPRVAGQVVDFYTDTGGGWNMLPHKLVAKLKLRAGQPVENEQQPDQPLQTVEFPEWDAAAAIPLPTLDRFLGNRLATVDVDDGAGFLGSRWFAGKVWAFDYGAHTLRWLEDGKIPAGMSRIPMTMAHERGMYWPRIEVRIDGEAVPMLLDTGATARLSSKVASQQGVSAGTAVATSFMIHSRIERWHQQHPDWQIIERGDVSLDDPQRMIEVPEVVVAGHAVGPVWFAERPDANFVEGMSMMTDAPVEGALGGSAYRYFRMVLDYPGQAAYFAPLIKKTPAG